MERRLVRTLLIRAGLFVLPFVAFFLWREGARRRGQAMGATPWTWLVAAGATLAALSLVVSAVSPMRPLTGTYVPAQVRPNGSVAPGYFVPHPGSSQP
jgi:Family of unknown function (DUF6111)